ncbi:UdgX family uracil-DNA binding protein [Sphingomonas sp. BN140010]|uniref:Type-4 uracil-DNA glycosylase n=1 Tax=Sphingomonas arvum TaxID=2992113 RepID=A0ABT3JC54_9SPHN|nr:UdgX family uracil-DNA binding protein [Sphingomonas sp. BN140010]MCW3796376.1 UdgX family uracil-DNA binding protein [Sphingomonas sp. BN140010]
MSDANGRHGGAAVLPDSLKIVLDQPDDLDGWRDAARDLIGAGVSPTSVVWQVAGDDGELFGAHGTPPPAGAPGSPLFSVPKPFIDVAKAVVCHREPQRFALLYAMLWKLKGDRHALEDRADSLVDRLERLAKEVRRDAHKMHAFVRFREVPEGELTRFVAFFEPEHHIVRREAGFFVRRFANMRWSILTPELSIHWDGETLTEGPGATRADAPDGDPLEETWRTYYASIFNPARLKIGAMLKEMPKKYWRNMPETALVAPLIAGARARELEMIERSAASQGREAAVAAERQLEPGGNLRASWEGLLAEARQCTRCDLYKCGTQTVFGEGPLNPRIFFVGEQPGDQEDLAGRPFIGPAGQLFDAALEKAGIDRTQTYVTNAVKHFKFVARGKKRIHSKPDAGEIEACRWWQEQERALIRPPLTVALGATAARSLTGKTVTISRAREAPLTLADGSECWITVHPSFLLRIPEEDRRAEERARFVEDLRRIRARSEELGG